MVSLTRTRTFSMCDIVIESRHEKYWIYAQDFSFETESSVMASLPASVSEHLDQRYLRVFDSMHKFTEWLFEMGAVVRNCWII